MRYALVFMAGALAGAILMQPGSAQNGPIDPRPERALNHVGIVVADYEAALAFYIGQLGLREAYTVESNGEPLLTYLQLNRETFIELIPARGDEATGITHFGIEVADIEATVGRMRDSGSEIADPGLTPANARFVRVRDHDNVDIEIMQFGADARQRQAMEAWR
jgi:catechol 2,3-dioxygenase-like lactoylglutathione lyase family enzyme